MPEYLSRNKHGVWHFRCRVLPTHVGHVIGQHAVKQTLGTGQRSVAVRRAKILTGQVFTLFGELEMKKILVVVKKLLDRPIQA
ncbi:MAG: DUF6538 domain-containing protein [Pseudomonadota bacterium]